MSYRVTAANYRALNVLHGLGDRVASVRQAVSDSLSGPRRSDAEEEVAQAWHELREHPALQWVPPLWRSAVPDEARASRYAISAVDRNLSVKIEGEGDRICVWLAVSPLVDLEVAGGVDPTTPASAHTPQIGVSAQTFERAVVELRDAVRERYSPSPVD